jgi:hypothetical protein
MASCEPMIAILHSLGMFVADLFKSQCPQYHASLAGWLPRLVAGNRHFGFGQHGGMR